MESITYEELRQAAKVFYRIDKIRNYVSKERFAMVAKTRFAIDDERKIDTMYGLMNLTRRLVYYIANEDNDEVRKETRWPEYMNLMPKTIEIALSAYNLTKQDWGFDDIPVIEYDEYRKNDSRRYFYSEDDEYKTLDVNLHSKADILLLSELVQRNDVKMIGVAEHLGYLEGDVKGNSREKFQYYEGDIYFLYGDVADRMFYSWYSRGDEAGVYIATQKGWRKLLYTSGRGYVDKRGVVEYEDDDRFYSNYKLEQSGMKFQYVGNIHCDSRVLRENKQVSQKEEE